MVLSGLKTWLETGELLTTPGSLMYTSGGRPSQPGRRRRGQVLGPNDGGTYGEGADAPEHLIRRAEDLYGAGAL